MAAALAGVVPVVPTIFGETTARMPLNWRQGSVGLPQRPVRKRSRLVDTGSHPYADVRVLSVRQSALVRCRCRAARTGSQVSSAPSAVSGVSGSSITRVIVHPLGLGLINQVRYVGGSAGSACSR